MCSTLEASMDPTFLIKGGNSRYYFRIKIPADLREIVGQGEVSRSLKTTNKMLASLLSIMCNYSACSQNMGKLESVTVQKCPGSCRLVAVVYDFVHEAPRPDEYGCC
jgi:hypothetical protein